jgi:hypothetical protein
VSGQAGGWYPSTSPKPIEVFPSLSIAYSSALAVISQPSTWW